MQINVSGHHLDVTDSLRNYIDDKFNRLERHSDKINNIKVTLTPTPKMHRADSIIALTGKDVVATAEASDMYAAIDMLADKLDRQILKHKDKAVSRKQRH